MYLMRPAITTMMNSAKIMDAQLIPHLHPSLIEPSHIIKFDPFRPSPTYTGGQSSRPLLGVVPVPAFAGINSGGDPGIAALFQ
jgi:hypothetical protein